MKIFLIIFLTTLTALSFAQDTVYLKNALSVNNAYHYSRSAIYTDALAYALYNNNLQQPVAGKTLDVNINAQSSTWQAVKADTNNVFKKNSADSNRYLYFTYTTDKEEVALINTTGSSALFVSGVLHAGDPYNAGWLYIPVVLKKGNNDIYIRAYDDVTFKIIKPKKGISLLTKDATLPNIVIKRQNNFLQGAIVVMNATATPLLNYKISSTLRGKSTTTQLPPIAAMTSRKVIFNIDQSAIDTAGKYDCIVKLIGDKVIDAQTISLQAVNTSDRYNNTFVSGIDGSLQYYSVVPQHSNFTVNSALFLSLHGAGVEASGQAAAYDFKDWGTLVAPTNRRPRGFNWEDWGRLDALEVLKIVRQKFGPDPQRIYLTGHSMGGHGAWFLGAANPDVWAAIAPCSGYPSLKTYGSADGKIWDSAHSSAEKLLLQASNQSDVLKLLHNYKNLGVYVLHGDSDKVVPVTFARQMQDSLKIFHTKFDYFERKGGTHWDDNQSEDWPALFTYFQNHPRVPDSAINEIDFTTSNPGVSSHCRWASVIEQIHPLAYSNISLQRFLNKDSLYGITTNVQLLKLNLESFANDKPLKISLDSSPVITITKSAGENEIYVTQNSGIWMIAAKPSASQKNPQRYGTFKDAFNNNMVFVYSTSGTKEENESSYNKAVYDAETWYYRGNGAMDMIADKDFSPPKYAGRNIIIYGNATTNSAWNLLLQNCPIQVMRGKITAGKNTWTGDDLAAYFVWPQTDATTSVGVITGTGIKGLNAAAANQYFAGGSGFPDFFVYSLSMLKDGGSAIKMTGFFDNNWKISGEDMVMNE